MGQEGQEFLLALEETPWVLGCDAGTSLQSQLGRVRSLAELILILSRVLKARRHTWQQQHLQAVI